MIPEKVAISQKREEDFFSDIIPIVAVEIARDIAEEDKFRGQQFDERVRWAIQGEIKRYLSENPTIRTAIFDYNFRDRGQAVLTLKNLYHKSIWSLVPVSK